MFENEQNQVPPTPQTPPMAPMPSANDIHTMPERFLDSGSAMGGNPTGGAPAGGRGKRMIMIVGISVVVLGGLGAGAWYYFTKLANSNTNTTLNTNQANVNRNANTNANANANVNTNLNTNLNVNTNLNANANLNVNTNLNTNSNSNTNSATTTGNPLPSTTDTDNDGFTDTEEQVYGTTTTNNDTDGDGFIDGYRLLANGKAEGESYNGYCPTKKGSVKLDDATCGIMRTYTNSTFSYALWVPKNWLAQPTNVDDKTVIITPDFATTEFFQVSVLDNPTQLSAKNYYLNLNPGVDPSKIKDATVNGLDGVLSLDESTVYFVKGTKTYVVTYNTDSLNALNLRTTFTIVQRSFHLVSGTTTNTNSSSNANGNTNTPPIFN